MHTRTNTDQRQVERIIATGLFACFALLYLAFRSISLDDFDSVSFVLAMENFDLALQQPQPPGFPVYIFLGRMFTLVFSNPVNALTTLSALSGAIAISIIYWIGRLLDERHPRTALFAAVLYGLLPVTWLTSAKALSDVPGMTAILLAMALWLWSTKVDETDAGKRRIMAAFVSGISLGIRPQNTLPLALLVLLLLGRTLIQRQWHRSWLYATLAGIAGILVWLVPVSIASGGVDAYIGFIQQHAEHVGRADSLFGLFEQGMSWTNALNARFTGFHDTSLMSLTAIDPYLARTSQQWVILAVTGIFGVVGIAFAPWKKSRIRGLGIWLFSMVIQSVLTITLDRPRLLLPIMPPLCLLVAFGWVNLAQRGHLLQLGGTLAAVAVIGCLLFTGLPLAQQLSTILTPPAQALDHIQDSFDVEHTIVVTAGSFRHAQYAASGYQLIYLYQFDAEDITAQLADGDIRTIAILDRDQFPAEAMDVLRHNDTFVTQNDTLFTRPRAVHTQHDQVRLQILSLAEDIPLSAMQLPEGGCIDLGTETDGKYLGAGWFRGEAVGGTSARWAGDTKTSVVRFATRDIPTSLSLHVRGMSYHTPQKISVLLNGKIVGAFILETDWMEAQIIVSSDLLISDAISELRLVHTEMNSPYSITNGSSADQRQLTAAWDFICISD